MRQYTIINPLYMAFYSKSLYRDVARNWSTRFCFLYLVSLLALCWIPGMIRIDTDISNYLDEEAPKYVNQLPVITITKGEASISGPQPYVIKNPEKGTPFMVIDTTGKTNSLEDSKAVILVTKKNILMKDQFLGSRSLNFSEFEDIVIDKSVVYDWIESFTEWFAILLYPFAILLSMAFRTVQVLIYAVVGVLFSKTFRVRLSFQMLIKLSCICLTPVIIFDTLITFFEVPIPEPWLINAALAAGYLLFSIRSSLTEGPE